MCVDMYIFYYIDINQPSQILVEIGQYRIQEYRCIMQKYHDTMIYISLLKAIINKLENFLWLRWRATRKVM